MPPEHLVTDEREERNGADRREHQIPDPGRVGGEEGREDGRRDRHELYPFSRPRLVVGRGEVQLGHDHGDTGEHEKRQQRVIVERDPELVVRDVRAGEDDDEHQERPEDDPAVTIDHTVNSTG